MENSEFDIHGGQRAASVSEDFNEAATQTIEDNDANARHRRAASTRPQSTTVDRVSSPEQGNKRFPVLAPRQVGFGTLTEWIDGATVQTIAENEDGRSSQASTGFAWSLYHHTLELFSLLFPLTLAWSVPTYNRQREKLFKKSLGRLFLWGDGFRGGKLETVLDESESLRETVIESLAAIGKILLFKLAPKCLENSTPAEHQKIRREIHDLGILVEKARIITESDYESDGSSNLSSTELAEDSSLGTANALGVYVGCLMELLPSMEETLSSLDYDEFEDKLNHPIDFQVSGPAQPYVLKVYDKFPKADLRLMHRLGEANWQRHMSLRTMDDQIEVDELPQEIPNAVFVAVSMFHDSGLGSSLPAQSTYAATMASHSSFQSTVADKNSGDLRVPPTPKQVFEGVPFSCQICGHTLTRIKNRIDWRRHVFADLKPYICTFSGCKDEFKAFPTRQLWEEHEFGQHRLNRYWSCSTCQYKARDPEEWRSHLEQTHSVHLSDDQYLLAAPPTEVRDPVPIDLESCPLCLEVPGKSRRHFATHVGKHMEGIALAALPRDEEWTDSESVASSVSSPADTLPRETTGHSLIPQSESTNAQSLPRLSVRATNRIHEHILKPLLAKSSLKDFHPIVKDCPRRIHSKEIVCLRDLEKTIIFMAPERTKTAALYLDFCLTSIRCIQATVEFLSDREQVRPNDRPYTNGYFVDLVDQIKQYAQEVQAEKEKEAKDDSHRYEDTALSERGEVKLHGGLTVNGKPAELIRVKKNGTAISIATGLPIDLSDNGTTASQLRRNLSEEAEDDESILRAMARRKKSNTLLEPKKCREPGCDKEFRRPCDLTKHEKTHFRPWKCPVESCKYHEYGWPTKKEMDRHHADKHVFPQPRYKCHFTPCPYESKRESNCKQHMEKAHGWEYVRSKRKNVTTTPGVPPVPEPPNLPPYPASMLISVSSGPRTAEEEHYQFLEDSKDGVLSGDWTSPSNMKPKWKLIHQKKIERIPTWSPAKESSMVEEDGEDFIPYSNAPASDVQPQETFQPMDPADRTGE